MADQIIEVYKEIIEGLGEVRGILYEKMQYYNKKLAQAKKKENDCKGLTKN